MLEAGHPLAIVETGDGPDPRTGVLEVSSGQVRYRMLAGQLSEAEVARLQAQLDAFQLRLRR